MVSKKCFIAEIGDMIIDLQVQSGIDQKQAEQVRDQKILEISIKFGGDEVYIPTVRKFYREKVAAAWRKGRTVRQLAMEFDMTERQIYNIVASL